MPNKVQPGDDFNASPIWEASFQNKLIDIVNHFDLGLLLNRPNSANTHGDDNNLIKIKNETGAHLAMGEVIRLGDYLLNTEEPKVRWYQGLAVSTTFSANLAVAAEPIAMDEIGYAYVSGMCPMRYTGTAPTKGDGIGPKPSSASWEKGYPSFAIVDSVVDSGTPKLVQATIRGITTLAGKADSNIAAMTGDTPGSGTVSIWYFNGTSYADTTMNVTGVKNKSKVAVTANEHITLLLVSGIWEVIFEACGGEEE